MVTAVWCVIGVRAKCKVFSFSLKIWIDLFIFKDGLEPTSTEGNHHLQQTQNILTNTTESFLTFTAAKLALASVLESNNLRIIPALSGLFILG